jgi:transcriptional regulator with XRE-family HTH domain
MKEKQTDSTIFGKRIYELRKERDWSQPQLARLIGASGTSVGRYERGR